MSIQTMETTTEDDVARLRLRSSLLEYLERSVEHHDDVVGAVRTGAIHRRGTMQRLAERLVQRDTALATHLDLLAEMVGGGFPPLG